MINTSAPLFAEERHEQEIRKQIAELYSRMYPIAAEDFTTTQDVYQYIKKLEAWNSSVQKALIQLFQVLSTHTHRVPPHTHAIEPHIHATPAGPSSPNANALITMPTPLLSEPPVEASQIKWTTIKLPPYVNSTGAPPNLSLNRVIRGPSSHGPLVVTQRRALPPKDLALQPMPPIIKSLKKGVFKL